MALIPPLTTPTLTPSNQFPCPCDSFLQIVSSLCLLSQYQLFLHWLRLNHSLLTGLPASGLYLSSSSSTPLIVTPYWPTPNGIKSETKNPSRVYPAFKVLTHLASSPSILATFSHPLLSTPVNEVPGHLRILLECPSHLLSVEDSFLPFLAHLKYHLLYKGIPDPLSHSQSLSVPSSKGQPLGTACINLGWRWFLPWALSAHLSSLRQRLSLTEQLTPNLLPCLQALFNLNSTPITLLHP